MLVCLMGISNVASATHIRAGDIVAQSDTTLPAANRNPFRFFFTMTIYLNSAAPVDQVDAIIDHGDGTQSGRIPRVSVVPVGNNTNKVTFRWEHTYPAGGTYQVCWTGENRNGGILNMSSSVAQSFFICTTITIDPQLDINRTPVLQVPPIDQACSGQIWVHNPGAFDADGDSVSFKKRIPQGNDPTIPTPGGGEGPVPGYRDPNEVGGTQADGSGPATFTLDEVSGQIVWNAPGLIGEYNIAFAIEEWRDGRKIGEVIRDMQILVLDCENQPPQLTVPRDLCVIAGTLVEGNVTAIDPDGNRINLSAISGILPPATFSVTGSTPGSAQGLFQWNTTCQDVREQPYQVVFRAEDVPAPPNTVPLVDLQPWNIRVVGPPPQGLQALVQNRDISLSWDSYTCQNASLIHIYRREGPSGFQPDSCQTGVPASTGYVKIAEVPASSTQYLDTNNGQGLKRSTTYCYLIYAEFPQPGGGASLASMEVCATLDANIPLLTNVTVLETDPAAGQIQVRWTQPREGLEQLTAPFRYRVLRAEGQDRNGDFAQVVYETTNLSDTTFVDPNLNTADLAYTYKLEFYHSGAAGGVPSELIDSSSVASSVWLAAGGDEADASLINLAWAYQVPWNNSLRHHYIYRQIDGVFTLIDSVMAAAAAGTYVDRGAFGGVALEAGQQYCYYVTTHGTYGNPKLPDRLLNNSQIACIVLPDRTPPCPPELTINPLVCDEAYDPRPPLQNELSWMADLRPECEQGIAFYTLYFRPSQEGEFTKLVETPELAYLHQNLVTTVGCYVVTATDSAGNESAQSNIVCQQSCDRFILPNVITPNGDGKNEVFRPDARSVEVRSVRFRVFNRWGVQVYESGDDPQINWGGVNAQGQPLSEGTYYYQAEVEFYALDPAAGRKTFKGWVEILR